MLPYLQAMQYMQHAGMDASAMGGMGGMGAGFTTQSICFTTTKVQILTTEELGRYSLYLLY